MPTVLDRTLSKWLFFAQINHNNWSLSVQTEWFSLLVWECWLHALLCSIQIERHRQDCMKNIDPFHIQKALDAVTGKIKNVTWLRNGTLRVETQNDKQADLLLKANFLGSYPVSKLREFYHWTSPQVLLILIPWTECRMMKSGLPLPTSLLEVCTN